MKVEEKFRKLDDVPVVVALVVAQVVVDAEDVPAEVLDSVEIDELLDEDEDSELEPEEDEVEDALLDDDALEVDPPGI